MIKNTRTWRKRLYNEIWQQLWPPSRFSRPRTRVECEDGRWYWSTTSANLTYQSVINPQISSETLQRTTIVTWPNLVGPNRKGTNVTKNQRNVTARVT